MTNKPMLSVDPIKLVAILASELAEWPEGCDELFQTSSGRVIGISSTDDEVSEKIGPFTMNSEGNDPHVTRAEFESAKAELTHKPAAEPQGEPVAWRYKKSWEKTGWKVCDKHPTDYGIDDECYEIQALYAEQPAPVAVDAEILERFPEINFANYGQDEVEALQAWAFEAYEAIARLNGVRVKNESTE